MLSSCRYLAIRRFATSQEPKYTSELAARFFSPTLIGSNRRLSNPYQFLSRPGARLLQAGERLTPLNKGKISNRFVLSKSKTSSNAVLEKPILTVDSGWSMGSPKRLNFIAQMVRGMSVEEAILQMTFSKKKAARKLLATLVRARARANAQRLPLERMILSGLSVARGKIHREIDIKGKGRHGIIKHYQSKVTITLSEPDYEKEFKKRYKLPRLVEHRSIQALIDY